MKALVTASRIIVGTLFIFSGLVKAIDPRGLAYKMQEFFEVWSAAGYFKGLMGFLHEHALGFSVFMITLEVALGVALLLGLWKRLTTWLLLLIMIFFTFLTAYVLFSGKIRECGCFGNCIPLTPYQTFAKDLLLLLLTLVLLFGTKYIQAPMKPIPTITVWLLATLAALLLQGHVLKHLPLWDCLPYKVGTNVIEARKMPKNAVPDKVEMVFIYQKGGNKQTFDMNNLPDSSWTFVERKDKVVQKGSNNVPLINDFVLNRTDGTDIVDSLLGSGNKYYLLFMKDGVENAEGWLKQAKAITEGRLPVYVVTGSIKEVAPFVQSELPRVKEVLTSDGTAIKTAARANPTLILMNGSIIEGKWGWPDFADAITN